MDPKKEKKASLNKSLETLGNSETLIKEQLKTETNPHSRAMLHTKLECIKRLIDRFEKDLESLKGA